MKRSYLWVWLVLLGGMYPLVSPADVTVETTALALVFSDQGSLIRATVCYPECGLETARRLHLEEPGGIIGFGAGSDDGWVQRRGLDLQQDGDAQQLHFTGSGEQAITWTIPANGYRIDVSATAVGALVMRGGEGFRPRPAAGFGNWLEQVRYVAIDADGVRQFGLEDEEVGSYTTHWAGFRNRFWTLVVSGSAEAEYEIQTGEEVRDAVVRRSEFLAEEQFTFHLGPVEPEELVRTNAVLGEMLYSGLWFWLRWICFGLYHLLGWIASWVPVWGLAIVLLAVTVHVLMLPLSRIADRLQQQVNVIETRLAPELSRIKKEFRGEEQAAKIIALYKTERVHPLYSLKSLLGVAVVIPVFIGAFDMLAENIHLLNTGFLWIEDLSRPDALMNLPVNLPFFGAELNLLPFLMTGLSVLASRLHHPLALSVELRNKQVRNMLLLALAFFALFYTFPAGMVLYWTTNNLVSVIKSLWARESILRT